MQELQQTDELEAAFERSATQPVLIFKHSETCGVSARALEEFRRHLERRGTDAALIVVQRARPVSDLVAEATGVPHASPQALLLNAGDVAWHASHGAITRDELDRQLDRLRN